MLIMTYWRMRGEYKGFKRKQRLVGKIQMQFRQMRTQAAYREIRAKTKVIQERALIRIAWQRVDRLRGEQAADNLSPEIIAEYVPDVDEMVNRKTGATLSLANAVAMQSLFGADVKGVALTLSLIHI